MPGTLEAALSEAASGAFSPHPASNREQADVADRRKERTPTRMSISQVLRRKAVAGEITT
jgi:hypothetical protein